MMPQIYRIFLVLSIKLKELYFWHINFERAGMMSLAKRADAVYELRGNASIPVKRVGKSPHTSNLQNEERTSHLSSFCY